jgi:signal transduction histidine kinase/ActR/RegA family two-component response regulator
MENDKLAWLCSELGLSAVSESDFGVVPNRAAVQAGCGGHVLTLEGALHKLLNAAPLPGAVEEALARARAGVHAACVLSGDALGRAGYRVVAVPHGPRRAHVIVAPAGIDASLELSRRASLVDVAAAVSHEVANAVGAIAGWAQLASSPGAGVSTGEALALIASCARTAQEAARSMLSLSRGEQVDEDQEIELSELADELLRLLSLTARHERVSLSGSIEPALCLRGSRAQMFTVLWNLTKNAVEACSPAGSVAVGLSAHGHKLVLEVRDTGPGLDSAEIAQMFAPYYTTKTAGTGLGLPLVQRAVRELGGEISVHSSKGRGTTFRVTLPRVVARDSRLTGFSESTERPSASQVVSHPAPELNARILVVDDDDALREMIGTALSLRGAEVVTAANGDEARSAEGRFDIALIDMMLDECRGDELLASLRRRGSVSAAMLVTGAVQKPKLVAGGEPDDWVRKPFEVSQLVDRIRRTLERHRMLTSVAAHGMR